MNSETLQLYINSIQHDFSHCAFKFEENGETNTTYWKYRQKAIVEGVKEDLASKEYLEPYSGFKIDFTAKVDFFTKYLFKFYEKAYIFSLGGKPNSYLTSMGIALMEFQQRLKNFKYHKSSLLHIKLEDPIAAYRTEKLIQLYFQKFLDEFTYCGIDLLKSPIGEDYNNIIKLFDGITSLEEIQIANEVTKISNQETNKTEPKILDDKHRNQVRKDEAETKHIHIFKNNAFEVWQSMFDTFEINERSRSDVKFMFEEMKKDGLIFKNITQQHFLEWIFHTYKIIIAKTSNHSRTKGRISIYSNAKQLYISLDT